MVRVGGSLLKAKGFICQLKKPGHECPSINSAKLPEKYSLISGSIQKVFG